MKRIIAALLVSVMMISVLPSIESVALNTDDCNGDWSAKYAVLRDTSEAELMVRVGDIDAMNSSNDRYNPFTATTQFSHGYMWRKDDDDPMGTDRAYVGSAWVNKTADGYASNYVKYKNGTDTVNAYGDGALEIEMQYDIEGIRIENVLLQICIDDFQPSYWHSNFEVKINGVDAPFISELISQIQQTGPTTHIISSVIPKSFYKYIYSGDLLISIDETTGVGDGYGVDFVKLLVNYNDELLTGSFTGKTTPGATVRLLGTATTVTAAEDGSFAFSAFPGLNTVRASKDGYIEKYAWGIVTSAATSWKPNITLKEGQGNPDIDFSQFAQTDGWGDDVPVFVQSPAGGSSVIGNVYQINWACSYATISADLECYVNGEWVSNSVNIGKKADINETRPGIYTYRIKAVFDFDCIVYSDEFTIEWADYYLQRPVSKRALIGDDIMLEWETPESATVMLFEIVDDNPIQIGEYEGGSNSFAVHNNAEVSVKRYYIKTYDNNQYYDTDIVSLTWDYKKGDLDDNGLISVADAMTALRISAELADATDVSIIIGDCDGNGEITVVDALILLRVSVKLMSEDFLK